MTKTCTKCDVNKPLTEFFKKRDNKDGHQNECKACRKVYKKAYYEENKEAILARQKAYDEENKEAILAKRKAHYEENKEEILARQQAHYEENKEEILARHQAHYEENKEEILARQKAYDEENKEARKAWRQTPRGRYATYKASAKQRGLSFSLTFEQFESFWQLPCSYCGTDIETIGLDRMDSEIGYEISNVTPCCFPCNALKGARPINEWNEWRARIAKVWNYEPEEKQTIESR